MTCQNTERNRPSGAHLLPEDSRWSDLLGHRKKSTDRWALTLWRRQREGLVRTRKKSTKRETNFLKTAEGGTCQDTEEIDRLRHSLPGDGRESDFSGHPTKPTEPGPLTNWRRQREGLVRTPKGIDSSMGAHHLKTTEGATCQDIERNRPSEVHSLPGDGGGSEMSGHRKQSIDRWALTLWRRQREGLVGTRKKSTERDTHFLETTEGPTR